MRAELKLGTREEITVGAVLDHDGEVEVGIVDSSDGYTSVYLTVEDLIKLRDHIDALLAEGKTDQ